MGASCIHCTFRQCTQSQGAAWRTSSNVGGVMLDGCGISQLGALRRLNGRHKIWLRCFDQSN